MEDQQIPVTIVTGFLGSGKSTLLGKILKENSGKKIAVLLNEFADSSQIERLSIKREDPALSSDDWVEGEAVVALERLMQKRGAYDHVVIETSGVADPGPLMNTFWGDGGQDMKLVFDGVVCVVDCSNLKKNILLPEFVRQVSFANVVILNKIDLVGESTLGECADLIRRLNSSCRIVQGSFAELPSVNSIVFGHSSLLHVFQDTQSNEPNLHFGSFDKISISVPSGFRGIQAFETWLQNLLWESMVGEEVFDQMQVLRVKGVLPSDCSTSVFLVHAVRDVYEITTVSVADEIVFKVIFIGIRLPAALITSELTAVFSQA